MHISVTGKYIKFKVKKCAAFLTARDIYDHGNVSIFSQFAKFAKNCSTTLYLHTMLHWFRFALSTIIDVKHIANTKLCSVISCIIAQFTQDFFLHLYVQSPVSHNILPINDTMTYILELLPSLENTYQIYISRFYINCVHM